MPIKFEKSNHKHKKYMVYYGSKWIHFGDTRYEQYCDKTPMKLYEDLNHYDRTRRTAYRKRAQGITDKTGTLTYMNKATPNYWSYHYLW